MCDKNVDDEKDRTLYPSLERERRVQRNYELQITINNRTVRLPGAMPTLA